MAATQQSDTPDAGKKKKKGTYNRISSSALFDISERSTKRQLDIPDSIYDNVKRLNMDLKPVYGRLSLHDSLLVILQAGIVALQNNPNAPREQKE